MSCITCGCHGLPEDAYISWIHVSTSLVHLGIVYIDGMPMRGGATSEVIQ